MSEAVEVAEQKEGGNADLISLAMAVDEFRRTDVFKSFNPEERLSLMVIIQSIADAVAIPKKSYKDFSDLRQFFETKVDAIRFLFDDGYSAKNGVMEMSDYLMLSPKEFRMTKYGVRRALEPIGELLNEIRAVSKIFVKIGQGTREDIDLFLGASTEEERDSFAKLPSFTTKVREGSHAKEPIDPKTIVKDFEERKRRVADLFQSDGPAQERLSPGDSQRRQAQHSAENQETENYTRKQDKSLTATVSGADFPLQESMKRTVYRVSRRLFADFDEQLALSETATPMISDREPEPRKNIRR